MIADGILVAERPCRASIPLWYTWPRSDEQRLYNSSRALDRHGRYDIEALP